MPDTDIATSEQPASREGISQLSDSMKLFQDDDGNRAQAEIIGRASVAITVEG
jgi:hypothetical protein